MLDKTIDSALRNLRKQMIRAGANLVHVDALLRQRGIDPATVRAALPKPADSCWHGQVKVAVVIALRNGPLAAGQVVTLFHAQHPYLTFLEARRRVYRAGEKMIMRGQMVRDGGRWRLTDSDALRKTSTNSSDIISLNRKILLSRISEPESKIS